MISFDLRFKCFWDRKEKRFVRYWKGICFWTGFVVLEGRDVRFVWGRFLETIIMRILGLFYVEYCVKYFIFSSNFLVF